MAPVDVNRREALRRLALGGAAVASTPLWIENLIAAADQHAAHKAAAKPATAAWTPKVLSASQNETVTTLSELIIPTTDTPGAKAAKVNEFIDGALARASAADRTELIDGLTWLDAHCKEQHKSPFVGLAEDQQIAVLTALSTAEHPSAAEKPGVDFFKAIKAMTITGYYTSQIGLQQEIGDDGTMFFTEFKGCTHPEHGA
jgi:hypothetical protein